MPNDLKIDKSTFDRFCEEAWHYAENEGEMWHPVNKYRRKDPFQIELMLKLCKYFDVPDPRISSGEPYSFDFYNDYEGHITRLLEGRMQTPFDFIVTFRRYSQTAIDRYKDEDSPQKPPRKQARRKSRR